MTGYVETIAIWFARIAVVAMCVYLFSLTQR